jgi:predicted GNAT family N-acyltransferase
MIVEVRATDPLMSAVVALRRQVFVVEQGVPEELEVDEDDKVATHLAALSDGLVIGTLRIVLHECTAKVGRVAVLASSRKKGIGRELMEFAAATVAPRRRQGDHSQCATHSTRILQATWVRRRRRGVR